MAEKIGGLSADIKNLGRSMDEVKIAMKELSTSLQEHVRADGNDAASINTIQKEIEGLKTEVSTLKKYLWGIVGIVSIIANVVGISGGEVLKKFIPLM